MLFYKNKTLILSHIFMKTISFNGKTLDYITWRNLYGGWGTIGPDDTIAYSSRRSMLPEEIKNKRTEHIKKLHAQGAPCAWIAKMYQISRTHVWRIIHDKPNN